MTHAGRGRASIPIYRWRQMRHGHFFSGGWTKSYLSMYSIYIVFLSFSQKIFSLATLARLRFILNLQMQYVLPTPFIGYIFFSFLVSLSLTASFQSSLKTRIKLHKIAYKCSKIVCGCGVGGGEAWRKRGGSRGNGGAPWLLGGRRPCM